MFKEINSVFPHIYFLQFLYTLSNDISIHSKGIKDRQNISFTNKSIIDQVINTGLTVT